MAQSDLIAGIGVVLALTAVAFAARAAAPDAVAQPGIGSIRLEQQGSDCRIAAKSPAVTVLAAGGSFSWRVQNTCREPASLDMREKRKKSNDATTDDPLASFAQSPTPIPPGGTGTIEARAKTQADLRPDPARKPSKHVWEFRWYVNSKRQNDPELEVEYRW
jgi:hypothetical protein